MHKQTIYLYEHDQAFRMGHEHQKDKLSQLSVLTRTSSLTHETPQDAFHSFSRAQGDALVRLSDMQSATYMYLIMHHH